MKLAAALFCAAVVASFTAPTSATTLTATLPECVSSDSSCAVVPPCTRATIESLFVYGTRRHETAERRLAAFYVRGMEGQYFSGNITTPDNEAWSAWTIVTNRAGKWKCKSEVVGVNLPTTDAPDTPFAVEREYLYDISGRRVELPALPGVYFSKRPGAKTGRVVVLK